MAVPSALTDLTVDESTNVPADTDAVTASTRPSDYLRAHAAILRRPWAKGADVASATAASLGSNTDGDYFHVTGTTGLAASNFGTVAAGVERTIVFDGALLLTHNATSFILPGGANITTAAGDVAVFRSEGSGNWKCTQFVPAAGTPSLATLAASAGASLIGFIHSGTGAVLRTLQAKARELGRSTADHDAAIDGAADDSTPLTNAIGEELGGTVLVPAGTSLVGDVRTNGANITGKGYASILKAVAAATTVLNLGYVSTPGQWVRRKLSNLLIDGNAKASNGLTYSASSSTEISGRWSLENVVIKACAKGIYKPTGNIGNTYRGLNLTGNDYGVYAVSQASPIMHAGCDTYEDCELSGNALAAIYYDSSVSGSGGVRIGANTVIQGNAGFGVFVKSWATAYTPFVMDQVWFEDNHTDASVTVDAVSYTPRDIYLNDTEHAVLQNGVVPEVELVNSRLTIDNCLFSQGFSSITADATSVVNITNASTDGGTYPFEFRTLARADRPSGGFSLSCLAPVRVIKSHDQGHILQSTTFANANTYAFTGTGAVSATTVADGRIFDSCAELSVPASYTLQRPTFTITTGKWYVFTLDVKHISGTLSELQLNVIDNVTFGQNLEDLLVTGEWKTVAIVAKAADTNTARLHIVNGATGAQVLRFSAMQCVEFDYEQEAIDYYNGGAYAMSNTLPRTIYSTVPPTTGEWPVGTVCINTAPALGAAPGWSCVFALATTLSAGEPSGETSMAVASGTGTANADIIGVTQDDGTIKWTTIASGGGTTTLVIASALTAAAALGNAVYIYRFEAMANLV